MSSEKPPGQSHGQEKQWFGHPPGLATLFFTEMWERFSFYGMRSLLVLYLTQHFLFSDNAAQGTYGAYAALVYLMPVLGGFLADRFLGARKAVTIGAVLLVFGHFGMAFEGKGASQVLEFGNRSYEITAEGLNGENRFFLATEQGKFELQFTKEGFITDPGSGLPAFVANGQFKLTRKTATFGIGAFRVPYEAILFLSLALIIVGVGFLKANISTSVGALYAHGDPRRDAGFTIFYMGINTGSFFATILCGWLGQAVGWWAGFGLAGLGMLAGLVQYLMGQKHLQGKTEPPKPLSMQSEAYFWIAGLIAVIPAWFLIRNAPIMEAVLPVVVPLLFVAMCLYVATAFKGRERSRMIAALVLMVFSVVFWMLYEQAGSSLSLYAERSSELTLAPGVNMQAAQTQSFNPFFIITLAPIIGALWLWLGKRRAEPSTAMKFAYALILVGGGCLVLPVGALFAGEDFRAPLVFLILVYLLHTLGELFLSPVGLSMVTKLSAARVVGLMMGIWFLSSSLAHILAAAIAQLTSAETVAGKVVDPAAQLGAYARVFTALGIGGVAAGLGLAGLSPWLKRAMDQGATDGKAAAEGAVLEAAN